MLIVVRDVPRLITVTLHSGVALSDGEILEFIESLNRGERDSRARAAPSTRLELYESEQAPNPVQRKRIADALNRLTHKRVTAMVTRSVAMRPVITGLQWLRRADPNVEESTHESYEGARAWLVSKTPHPASAFDALIREAREEAIEETGSHVFKIR